MRGIITFICMGLFFIMAHYFNKYCIEKKEEHYKRQEKIYKQIEKETSLTR